jgi:hypothetical protein
MHLLEVARPYDSRPDFAARSDCLKILRYQPVANCFHFHEVARRSGWTDVVIPPTFLRIPIQGCVVLPCCQPRHRAAGGIESTAGSR